MHGMLKTHVLSYTFGETLLTSKKTPLSKQLAHLELRVGMASSVFYFARVTASGMRVYFLPDIYDQQVLHEKIVRAYHQALKYLWAPRTPSLSEYTEHVRVTTDTEIIERYTRTARQCVDMFRHLAERSYAPDVRIDYEIAAITAEQLRAKATG